jgi:hypothetical protein
LLLQTIHKKKKTTTTTSTIVNSHKEKIKGLQQNSTRSHSQGLTSRDTKRNTVMNLQKTIGNQAVQRLIRSGDLATLDIPRTASINGLPSELLITPSLEIAATPAEAETMREEVVTPTATTTPITTPPTSTLTDTEAAPPATTTSTGMKVGEAGGAPAAGPAQAEKAAPAEEIAVPSKKLEEKEGKRESKEAGGEAPEIGEAATITPPMETGVPPAATMDRAPASPDEDPAFKAVIVNAESVAQQQKRHPSAKIKAQEAKAAAKPPPKEALSEAQASKVENMDAQAEKPLNLDAASFKQALKEALEKQLNSIKIQSEDDAENFKKEDRPTKIKENVVGIVNKRKDTAQAPIREANGAPLNIPSKEDPPELVPPQPGSPPPGIEAHKAIPKPKTDSEVSLEEDSKNLDQQMIEADVTEEQLEMSNEPDFQAALAEKREAQTHAIEAPLAYRQDEQVLLADARADAVSSTGTLIRSVYGTRKNQFKQTGDVQESSKTDNEKRRAEVAGHIESIYKETEGEVKTRLESLDTEVNGIFEGAATEAKRLLEEKVSIVSEYYSGISGGLLGAAEWVGITEEPKWVGETFKRGRELYVEELEKAVDKIADTVETRLSEIKTYIDAQWLRIKNYVDELGPGLQEFAKDAAKKIEGKFNTLRQSVDEKFTQIVDSLAQKYADNLKKIDERIEELKKEKGFIVAAGRAIGDVIKTIGELKDMILNVLTKAANVIDKIIAHPIRFLENLVNGVKKGLGNFKDNIGMHLERGLVTWLFGELGETGIQMPESFDPMGVFSLVLQVLGLTYPNVRARAVKLLGENIVSRLELAAEIFRLLITQGPIGLWGYIKDKVSDLKTMVVGGIESYIRDKVIWAGIEWLFSLLVPFAGFIKAAKGIYNVIKFFVTHRSQIAELVNAILDSIDAIADGAIDVAATLVEAALGKAVPIAIGFLASLLNLGGIGKAVRGIIQKIQEPINGVIDWIIQKAVDLVKAAGKLFGIGKEEKAEVEDPQKAVRIEAGLVAIDEMEQQYVKEEEISLEDAVKIASKVKEKHPIFKSITVISGDGTWDYDYIVNPRKRKKGEKKRKKERETLDPELTLVEILDALARVDEGGVVITESSIAISKSNIRSILSGSKAKRDKVAAAIEITDKILEAARKSNKVEEIEKYLRQVSGVTNEVLAVANSPIRVNADHATPVERFPGTFVKTRWGRMFVHKKYKPALDQWIKDNKDKKPAKQFKAELNQIKSLLRDQIFDQNHAYLEMPLKEIEIVIITVQVHRRITRERELEERE